MDNVAERFPCLVFAVSNDRTRSRWRHDAEPVEQSILIGVSTEATHGVDGSPHRNLLAEYIHGFCAINQFPTESSFRLEAHNQHRRLRYRQVMSHVMHDSATCAHTTSGHDQRWSLNTIERPRIAGFGTWLRAIEIAPELA